MKAITPFLRELLIKAAPTLNGCVGGLVLRETVVAAGSINSVDLVRLIRLSKNFRLSEFTKSDTAVRLGIDNVPNEKEIKNLERLVNKVIQPVRDWLGQPLIINSGFRCLELNRALKSSDSSQHVQGNAADIESIYIDNYELACWIRDNLEFDQLILEFYDGVDPTSGWVHVSYSEYNRKECLTIVKGNIKRGLVK